ncbi:MAG: ferritin-like domain-containing protein [Candidatus Sericytochromatia bacterium]|nr:ferritin-like domain-containing protein [Candidatus Tanganyikabacteria bacterium]
MSSMLDAIRNAAQNRDTFRDAARSGNLKVIFSLVGPALRGFVLQKGKQSEAIDIQSAGQAHFDWNYGGDRPDLVKLYENAKRNQWNGSDLAWRTTVDPHDPATELLADWAVPIRDLPAYRALPRQEQEVQKAKILAWLLSQFLHGEQGALFAACQVTVSAHSGDAKLYGSSQVVDEGRHVEVFNRYLVEKLEKRYLINDNLYVILDALMTDSRWDMKFLGMQILIEGLALGAFGTLREATREPLLRDLLRRVIADEARHVHFGVLALEGYFTRELSEADRREREDWAYEIALFMRNRFLAHEFYEEYYGHLMSRAAWDRSMLDSDFMRLFRTRMFRRLVPNLRRIGLLSDRVRPHYAALGLLEYEHEPSAPELSAEDLLG